MDANPWHELRCHPFSPTFSHINFFLTKIPFLCNTTVVHKGGVNVTFQQLEKNFGLQNSANDNDFSLLKIVKVKCLLYLQFIAENLCDTKSFN